MVHRRCRALLQSAADADDAVQDVFLRVSRSSGPSEAEAALSWLYTIAFNVCCDRLKRARRERVEPPEVMRTLDARTVGSVGEADAKAVVGGALRAVGRRTREIVVLHHVSGLTQEEVAAASGYSRKTVGKKLKAFSALLESRWKGRGVEP